MGKDPKIYYPKVFPDWRQHALDAWDDFGATVALIVYSASR